ncbi:MAG: cobalt ECF transporter T component CbiQ [Candidatus Promineifilaceae bacterium]|nr:cobalt ECF transporter T component CbiQ [Candidatus Promineifilaceae bacterium]
MVTASFDRYQRRDSIIHRLDARVKVVIAVLFIVSNVFLPDGAWLAFAIAWALVLLTVRLAQLALTSLLKRSLVALPFALAAVTIIFTHPGETLAAWRVGSWTITATEAGLVRFASIMLRSWISVQMALLLAATTPFPDLMHALRHLRVPAVLITIISFMYRYLFVVTDEAGRLLRARAARSARPAAGQGGGSLLWRARTAGNMVGQLLLRSVERSERVYNAMAARGYRGHFLTMNPHVMSARDWLACVVAVAWLVSAQMIGRL